MYVNHLCEILFKELGASLQAIGLTSLFHLPWNLKFLWGPLLDKYESKRRWLLWVEVALSVMLVAFSFLLTLNEVFGLLSIYFLILAFLSATHDVAIDGYYLEALDEDKQASFVGYRVAAYRVAMVFVQGPLIVFIGRYGWTWGAVFGASIMLLLTLYHWCFLPVAEKRRVPFGQLVRLMTGAKFLITAAALSILVVLERQLGVLSGLWEPVGALVKTIPILGKFSVTSWIAFLLLVVLVVILACLPLIQKKLKKSNSFFAKSYVSFLAQPKAGLILAFVILFRTGESFLQKMRYPFLKDQVGLSLEQYGWANGTIGILASIVATILAGKLISRQGLRRWIWPFVLAQNCLNLLYMLLASIAEKGPVDIWFTTGVIAIENFGAGLGTAVLMVYIMRCCDPGFRAGHMAIVTALMSLSFTIAGVGSGFIADSVGFANYFGFTFLATLPGMILIFFIPHLDGRETA